MAKNLKDGISVCIGLVLIAIAQYCADQDDTYYREHYIGSHVYSDNSNKEGLEAAADEKDRRFVSHSRFYEGIKESEILAP